MIFCDRYSLFIAPYCIILKLFFVKLRGLSSLSVSTHCGLSIPVLCPIVFFQFFSNKTFCEVSNVYNVCHCEFSGLTIVNPCGLFGLSFVPYCGLSSLSIASHCGLSTLFIATNCGLSILYFVPYFNHSSLPLMPYCIFSSLFLLLLWPVKSFSCDLSCYIQSYFQCSPSIVIFYNNPSRFTVSFCSLSSLSIATHYGFSSHFFAPYLVLSVHSNVIL